MSDINTISLNIHKRLGDFTLDINCNLRKKVTAFLGASGSGKTTLLNCISGILSPDKGKIVFGNRTLYASDSNINIPLNKRRFGYVFQEGYLFPHLSVEKNIGYSQPHYKRKNQDSIYQVLDILEITDLLERYPSQLSGGQRQRVAIARALAMEPQLLLMDEPLASLDSGLKSRIIPYLHHIKNAFEVPILYVTHAVSEAMSLADEAFLLTDGKVTASGEPYQLISSPSALPIANLTGVENIFSLPVVFSDKQRGITELEIGSQYLIIPYIDAEIGKTVPVAIRAEDIIISLEPNLPISARNILHGTVEEVDDQVLTSILVEGLRFSVKITHEAREQLNLCKGKKVYCVIKANAINLLWHDS